MSLQQAQIQEMSSQEHKRLRLNQLLTQCKTTADALFGSGASSEFVNNDKRILVGTL
jgi:hypothetical protein